MYRKTRSGFLAIIILLCLILISISGTEAQLNFSTGWGKRSQKIGAESSATDCASRGRPSLEQLLSLYSFIQIEADKILDCQKLNK